MAKDSTSVFVHVTPHSGRDEVYGVVFTSDESGIAKPEIQLRVRAIADGGKANKAVCELLATELDIPKSYIAIESGQISRRKRMRVLLDEEKVSAYIEKLPRL